MNFLIEEFLKTSYNYNKVKWVDIMNNRGSLLLEALVMFILLVMFFLVVWRAVDGYMQRERVALFHDDIATLYQGYYVKEALLRYTQIQTWGLTVVPGNMYGRVVGNDFPPNFFRTDLNAQQREDFNNIMTHLNLHQIFVTNTANINNLRNCARNTNFSPNSNCGRTFMDEEMRTFIRGINRTPTAGNHTYLIITFRRNHQGTQCLPNQACFSHFTWIRM